MTGSKNHHGDMEKKELAINSIFFSDFPRLRGDFQFLSMIKDTDFLG
jgi:hypothetical protein